MRDKYLILYKGNETRLQTKQQIQDLFTIPLYIVNKAIKKTNAVIPDTIKDPNYVAQKIGGHQIYKDFMNEISITLIKPELIS